MRSEAKKSRPAEETIYKQFFVRPAFQSGTMSCNQVFSSKPSQH